MPRRRRTQRSERKRTGVNLTRGELNKIIDAMFHRHFSKRPSLIFVDGLAHAIVENDPEESLRKFLKYGIPALLKGTGRKKRRRRG